MGLPDFASAGQIVMLDESVLVKIVLAVVIGLVALGPFSAALNWPIKTVHVTVDLPPPAAR